MKHFLASIALLGSTLLPVGTTTEHHSDKKLSSKKTNEHPLTLDEALIFFSNKEGIDPKIVRAMIRKESRGILDAKSPKGAIGLLQLLPKTARLMGVDPYDPLQNLQGGIGYFAQQLRRFKKLDLALAAYNAGPSRVAKAGKVPNLKETKNYVNTILEDLERIG